MIINKKNMIPVVSEKIIQFGIKYLRYCGIIYPPNFMV